MNAVYSALGTSKQAFHKSLDRHMEELEEVRKLVMLVQEIRTDHPKMSVRVMYKMLNPYTIGRDKFEAIMLENGFRVRKSRNFRKTTDSRGIIRYDNLISGLKPVRINQVWVSDITYYELNKRFYYLTFLMDLSLDFDTKMM